MSGNSQASQFGPNEWLIEEMYERFLADPSSVDAAWHDFFADYKPTTQVGMAAATAAASSNASGSSPGGTRVGAPVLQPPTPDTSLDGNGQAPARPAPQTSRPTSSASTSSSTPDRAKPKPTAKVDEDGRPLRGAAAAVVKNMTTSLTIPTATSVRAVPAKLLGDNRIVINNHLKRTRGGKVSFTHLIGYAVVKALESFPSMNRHYAEVDGKPVLVSPEHVNLGLAIDLPGKDGQRTLVVASIKGCETMSFTQFWQAYEDIVRKARNGALTSDDFSGTTISLTNPGTIGTNHSMPRLMAGQGAIIGVGASE